MLIFFGSILWFYIKQKTNSGGEEQLNPQLNPFWNSLFICLSHAGIFLTLTSSAISQSKHVNAPNLAQKWEVGNQLIKDSKNTSGSWIHLEQQSQNIYIFISSTCLESAVKSCVGKESFVANIEGSKLMELPPQWTWKIYSMPFF